MVSILRCVFTPTYEVARGLRRHLPIASFLRGICADCNVNLPDNCACSCRCLSSWHVCWDPYFDLIVGDSDSFQRPSFCDIFSDSHLDMLADNSESFESPSFWHVCLDLHIDLLADDAKIFVTDPWEIWRIADRDLLLPQKSHKEAQRKIKLPQIKAELIC